MGFGSAASRIAHSALSEIKLYLITFRVSVFLLAVMTVTPVIYWIKRFKDMSYF